MKIKLYLCIKKEHFCPIIAVLVVLCLSLILTINDKVYIFPDNCTRLEIILLLTVSDIYAIIKPEG